MYLFKEEFRAWLIETKGFTNKSASDVLSRANRVSQFVNFQKNLKLTVIMTQLDDSPGFHEVAINVKSHLRRVIRLYMEFRTGVPISRRNCPIEKASLASDSKSEIKNLKGSKKLKGSHLES